MYKNIALVFIIITFSSICVASYKYQGPNQSVSGKPKLIRIEVLIRDSPRAGGFQIQEVVFNGERIPLQPRDIYGNRGSGSFQIPPGQYKLSWVVQRDRLYWPRTIRYEEEVNVDPRDLWLQIEIVGDTASIT
ncbi:MAG TPA: hypothetical protein VLE95_00665 [Chlamydiales bacterium]|nr:hypothetical protein [Chlamydiales bacterium]